ncbi:MAG: UTP--glucose-1-phosphate uridylyltransferase [bacterium]|nr:UTP--glucose-1-phosphate uridylyltransferase [bacterium]
MKVTKVVIPAAGKGTRFLPATKSVPKELLPLVDRPLIHEVVLEAARSGIRDLILVTAEGKEAVQRYFEKDPALENFLEARGELGFLEQVKAVSGMVRVSSVIQDSPRGLGHAILCSRGLVGNDPFAVILPDDLIDSVVPCVAQLADLFVRTGKTIVALQEVPGDQTHLYGIADGERTDPGVYRIRKFVEKPPPGSAPSNLAVIGRYILVPEIYDLIEGVQPGVGGEIQLTDALDRLAVEDEVYGLVFEGLRHDAGTRLGFLMANIHYGLKDEELGPPLLRYITDKIAAGGT